MEIRNATYVKSSAFISQCPNTRHLPEYAFIGRSNVGKSSLINMLTGNRRLAKTSATPGKTLLINHFEITSAPSPPRISGPVPATASAVSATSAASPVPGTTSAMSPVPGGSSARQQKKQTATWYLVDLPGYGFAKRSKTERVKLENMITGYILQRQELTNLFLLIDCRHEPQAVDLEFMDWLGESHVPFSIVFTKADKLGRQALEKSIEAYMQRLSERWEPLPPHFVTSAETRQGRDELLAYIEQINKEITQT